MDRRLDGWKSIAAFLGRDERTAKRWEASRGLPVHRVPGGGSGSVFANAAELTAWLGGATAPAEVPVDIAAPARPPARFGWRIAAGLVVAVLLIGTLAIGFRGPRATIDRPENAQAANHYLAGLHALSGRTPAGIEQAIRSFNATLAIEPRYAPALVGLADSYNLIREFGTMPEAEAYPKAEKAARAAIAIDPANAGAHRALAFVLFNFRHEAPAAEAEFRKALELGPGEARTHHWWATTLLMLGRPEEALREIDRARALDPEVTAIQADRALILARLGQVPEARAELARLAALDPATPGPPRWGARLALIAHDGPAFVALSRTAARLRGDPVDAAITEAAARGLAAGGWNGMLDAMRAEVETLHGQGKVDDYQRAEIAALGGDVPRTVAVLRQMIVKHEPRAVEIYGDLQFARALRADPALAAMARAAIGMPATPD